MTLRKEDSVINTNYNNHAGLGGKMPLKKKKEEGKRNLSKRKSPGAVETHAGLKEPKGTVK